MTTSGHKAIPTSHMTAVAVHDDDIEQIIIASLLQFDKAREKLRLMDSDDFYSVKNKDTFNAIKEYAQDNKDFDIYTVPFKTEEFVYLAGKFDILYSKFDYYLTCLKEMSSLRKIQGIAYKMTVECEERKDSVDIKNNCLNKLEVIKPHDLKDIHDINYALKEYDKVLNYDSSNHISTGFVALDEAIGGFVPSRFYAVGGVPCAGKTTFIVNLIHNVLRNKKKVLFVSMETKEREIINKFVSNIIKVDSNILSGFNKKTHYSNWDVVNKEIGIAKETIRTNYKQYILGGKDYTVSDIKDRAKYMGDVDIVFVDYLQLLKASGGKSRYEEISKISRELKLMATELDLPVVSVASINRSNVTRLDKRPQLSDFRDSGNIEYDLDCALLLYRESQFKPDVDRSYVEIILAKNRYGKSGIIFDAQFKPEFSYFDNFNLKES